MCGGFTCSKNALTALNVLYIVSIIHHQTSPLDLPSVQFLWTIIQIIALIIVHSLFQVVAAILIGVAVYGRASAVVTNLPIIGGILACGVILFLISILGLIGAIKHHQVLLFFVSFAIRNQRTTSPSIWGETCNSDRYVYAYLKKYRILWRRIVTKATLLCVENGFI